MQSILVLLTLVVSCTALHVTISKCCPHGYGIQDDGFVCLEYHVSDADVSWLPRDTTSAMPDNITIFTIVPKMHHGLEFKFEPCPQADVESRDLFISQESSQHLQTLPNGSLIVSDGTSVSFTSDSWCVDRAISYDGEQTGIRVLSCSSMKSRIPVCCKNSAQVDSRRIWMECMTDLSEENEIVPEPFSCESPAYREHGVVQSILATTGSMFSLLTLAIHADSPRLRRGLKGFSLMSHCACMLFAHVFLALRPFAHNWGAGACVTVATITQFTLLAAFFWINVRAIIIHSKYRSLSAMLGKAKGLVWYILYAFGVPLFISSLTLWAQISQNRPNWIIWPHIHHDTCWFGSAAGRGAYFSAPMGGVLLMSLALFFAAAHKVVRMRRDTAMYLQGDPLHNARSKRADFRRLKLYLKLYVLMGLTFSAELLAWVGYLLSYYWYTSGIFIVLRAVLIFIIFCCSSKIWSELLQRHQRLRKVLLSCKVHRIAGDAIFYVDQDKMEFSQTSTSVSRRNGHLYNEAAQSVTDVDGVDCDLPQTEGTLHNSHERDSELVVLGVSELLDHQTKSKLAVVGRNYCLLQTSGDPNLTNSLSQSEDESCTESEQDDLQEINLNEDGIENAENLRESSRFHRVMDVCSNHFARIKNRFTSS